MTAPREGAWYREISGRPWRALVAALLGWMLDGMDVMLYAFALTAIRSEFGLGPGAAGSLASLTLVASAAGGIAAGVLADRFGRARVLIWSILAYALCTGATATARSVAEVALWRTLVGLGLGAEWSAGSVLVAESWPAAHRGKAIGLMQSGWAIGYILAAILSALVLPAHGWRALFALGVLPALLTVWIRRRVPEPEIWLRAAAGRAAALRSSSGRPPAMTDSAAAARPALSDLLRPPLRKRAVIATLLATSVLFAYWGLFTWMPTYLAAPRAEGGAGLGLVKSAAWIVPMQIGAFFGYTLFGVLADRFGRRPVFLVFVLASAVLAPIYGLAARSEMLLLALGPLVGFFGHGYFSLFGAMLAEIFPSAIRATAQGLCYNAGRAVSALAPPAIGAIAGRLGFGAGLAFTAAFFLLGAMLILLLPETKGRELT